MVDDCAINVSDGREEAGPIARSKQEEGWGSSVEKFSAGGATHDSLVGRAGIQTRLPMTQLIVTIQGFGMLDYPEKDAPSTSGKRCEVWRESCFQ